MRHQPRWLRDLGNTRNGVFAVDSDQRILTWNQAAADLLGHRASEVIGRRCYEVFGGRLGSGARFCGANCPVQRCVRREKWPQDEDLVAITAAGQPIQLTVSSCTVTIECDPVVIHTFRPASRPERREDALEKILASLQSYLSAQTHDPLAGERPTQPAATEGSADQLATLGRRESEVLALLTQGYSASDAAQHLGVSLLTIRSHIRNMLRKTGLHRQAQIVLLALRKQRP